MELTGDAYLSPGVESLLRVRYGMLSDKKQGLFIASQYNKSGVVTDIFTSRNGLLVNVSASLETGVSEQLIRYTDQAATDINGDGVMDLPRLEPLPPYDSLIEEVDPVNEIFWYSYDSWGRAAEVAHTYHSLAGNWFLSVPQAWRGRLTVGRQTTTASRVTTFACYMGDGEPPVDLLTITALSARPENDYEYASDPDYVVLINHADLFIYASLNTRLPAEISGMAMTEAELRAGFATIRSDWIT